MRFHQGHGRTRSAFRLAAVTTVAVAPLAAVATLSGSAQAATSPFVMPATVDFGTVQYDAVPSDAPVRTVTLKNQQLLPTTQLKVALSGADAAAFTVVSDTCANKVVLGGGTCAVTLKFFPATSGVKSATLKISGLVNAAQSTLTGGLNPPPTEGPGIEHPGPVDPADGP